MDGGWRLTLVIGLEPRDDYYFSFYFQLFLFDLFIFIIEGILRHHYLLLLLFIIEFTPLLIIRDIFFFFSLSNRIFSSLLHYFLSSRPPPIRGSRLAGCHYFSLDYYCHHAILFVCLFSCFLTFLLNTRNKVQFTAWAKSNSHTSCHTAHIMTRDQVRLLILAIDIVFRPVSHCHLG